MAVSETIKQAEAPAEAPKSNFSVAVTPKPASVDTTDEDGSSRVDSPVDAENIATLKDLKVSEAEVDHSTEKGSESVEAPALGSITAKLASELAFDPAVIKEKYLKERDKRIRPEGNAQYKEFKGQFSHYLVDPYVPRVERDPINTDTDFLVLGGGFGGLCLAAELVKAGIKDFKVIDKAGDFGGTWYWNRCKFFLVGVKI
jgi:NAD(P)-binding Rossmann-like domain